MVKWKMELWEIRQIVNSFFKGTELVLPDKTLSEPILTKFYDAICHNEA